MNAAMLATTERGQDLVRQWNDRCAAAAPAGVTEAFPDIGSALVKLLPFLVPILVSVLSGGFTPALLLTLLPEIIKQVLPDLDSSLVELLKQIIAHIISK